MSTTINSDPTLAKPRSCRCNALTVAALCQEEPVLIADDLAVLEESANRGDGPCQFCRVCLAAMTKQYGEKQVRKWVDHSIEMRKRGDSFYRVTAVGNFNFLKEVPSVDGLLPKSRESSHWKLDIPNSLGILAGSVMSPLSVFALPHSKGASYIEERCSTIESDPDQKARQELTERWTHECSTSHDLCASLSSERTGMPTRVIDLADGPSPRLVNTSGRQGKYMALSYCWGPQSDDLLMLTHETMSILLDAGIKESRFAQTHQDAFEVARSVGIRYVWIDALCIIQRDGEDWEHESKRMAQVYGNAFLTLVAGSSSDSRAGFLKDRSSAVKPCPLPLDSSNSEPFLYALPPRPSTEGPTRTRGWCFQESMLSRRTLIFGTDLIMFQCPTGERLEHTENRPMDGVMLGDVKAASSFRPEIQLLGKTSEEQQQIVLEHWYIMLRHFTSRSLSNPHDVFASLSSLAQSVAPYLGQSRYLAGIWEVDMVRGLLWRPSFRESEPTALTRPSPTAFAPPPVVRAPSWSWAAVEGAIDHLDYEPFYMPGMTVTSSGAPVGARIKQSVFATRPDFVRVSPAVQSPSLWSDDTCCGPDVLHMPACELRIRGFLTMAAVSDQQVNLRKWRPQVDWQPPEHRAPTNMFNGKRFVFEPQLMIYQHGRYLLGGENQDRSFAVGLFDVKDEECRGVWCLQLTEVEGLLLSEVRSGGGENKDVRRFRRLGLFWIENADLFGPEKVEICLV
ncbi:hypothetical protein PG999_009713 [Apiospora kogelbergensis]|uniref:Heterokaryon incompatibility domain-containing protein n=1 Tax=Apiospora kogelbergensis TaxID=1337665 RepID=A0AAW0QLQ7_9PEZI